MKRQLVEAAVVLVAAIVAVLVLLALSEIVFRDTRAATPQFLSPIAVPGPTPDYGVDEDGFRLAPLRPPSHGRAAPLHPRRGRFRDRLTVMNGRIEKRGKSYMVFIHGLYMGSTFSRPWAERQMVTILARLGDLEFSPDLETNAQANALVNLLSLGFLDPDEAIDLAGRILPAEMLAGFTGMARLFKD